MASPDLSRFDQFLAISPEDIQAREQLGIGRPEIDDLHTSAVKGEVTWDFYHAVSTGRKADFIYKHDGQSKGWSIAFIRERLGRVDYRQYTLNGEDVQEWVYGRIFPRGDYIRRIRTQRNPLRIIDELELAHSPDIDLESLWERQGNNFELEGIQLIQRFPDNQFVQEICFLPGDPNFECRFIISAGTQRKELTFPIALRYKPLLKRREKDYTLDITKDAPDLEQPLQRASTEEIQEALLGLRSGVLTYNPAKGPIASHLKKTTKQHMGEEFKKRSSSRKDSKTGKPQRVLRASLDREEGSLDDLLQGEDGDLVSTRGSRITDSQVHPPDQGILLREVLDSLVDETDKQIVHRMLGDESEKEIAAALNISAAAVTKRLKRLGKRLET